MSTRHSSPESSLERSNAAEVESNELSELQELRGNHKLASRIFAAARKPMSTPKYAALLIALALVFGLGSWGIIRGVQNYMPETSNKGAEVQIRNNDFFAVDNHGNMRAVNSYHYNEEEIFTLPSTVSENDYILRVTGLSYARCSLSLDVNDVDNGSIFGDAIKFDTVTEAPADNAPGDDAIPLFHHTRPYQVRIKWRECRPFLVLDLLKIKNMSEVNWDGTSPFLGTGMTVIHSTSGAGIYTFDDVPHDFQATVYVGETLSSLTHAKIKLNKNEYGSNIDSFKVSDAASNYIVVLPLHKNVSWTLKKQINAGDAPVQ